MGFIIVMDRVFETDQPAADLHLELCLAVAFGLLNRRAVRLIVQVVVAPLVTNMTIKSN